jgi:selenocysteine lyase/cysteine desulfurase
VAIPNAVGEALTFQDAIGPERKAARLRVLRHRWMDRLADVPRVRFYTADDDVQAGALATMSVDGLGAAKLTDVLQERYRIHVRPRFVRGEWEGIRVTPNMFSTLDEVDRFSEAIEEIAGS